MVSALCGLVFDLRAKLTQVKRELSVVLEENRPSKEVMEKLCGGGYSTDVDQCDDYSGEKQKHGH